MAARGALHVLPPPVYIAVEVNSDDDNDGGHNVPTRTGNDVNVPIHREDGVVALPAPTHVPSDDDVDDDEVDTIDLSRTPTAPVPPDRRAARTIGRTGPAGQVDLPTRRTRRRHLLRLETATSDSSASVIDLTEDEPDLIISGGTPRAPQPVPMLSRQRHETSSFGYDGGLWDSIFGFLPSSLRPTRSNDRRDRRARRAYRPYEHGSRSQAPGRDRYSNDGRRGGYNTGDDYADDNDDDDDENDGDMEFHMNYEIDESNSHSPPMHSFSSFSPLHLLFAPRRPAPAPPPPAPPPPPPPTQTPRPLKPISQQVEEANKGKGLSSQGPSTLQCAVCLDSIDKLAATTCGHVFCETCIQSAVSAQHKCPICRTRLTAKQIHPLFV